MYSHLVDMGLQMKIYQINDPDYTNLYASAARAVDFVMASYEDVEFDRAGILKELRACSRGGCGVVYIGDYSNSEKNIDTNISVEQVY